MHLPIIFTTGQPTPGVLFMWLLINVAAVARICRLIAMDTISEKPRHALQSKYQGMLVTLSTCTWCLGVWFAAAATVLMCFDVTRPWWLLVAAFLTVAMFAGALVNWAG
jgi:hypothetical protein